jgi:RNA polymerase sigma-70 factor, ECF subfamily
VAVRSGGLWEPPLNLPLGTVLAQLHRGRNLFEKRLWDYAETHGLLKEPIR